MALDWQLITTLLIVAAAAAYLLRRWWPRRTDSRACGTGGTAKSGCAQGCGSCGSDASTPHRVHGPAPRGERTTPPRP